MKVILEFNLPEEHEQYDAAQFGLRYCTALSEATRNIEWKADKHIGRQGRSVCGDVSLCREHTDVAVCRSYAEGLMEAHRLILYHKDRQQKNLDGSFKGLLDLPNLD